MDCDVPVEPKLEDTQLRTKIREYARQQRTESRTNASDALRFGLGQIKDAITELENLTVKDVHGMASRIKRRKHASSQDMYRLSHAFLQGNANINAFAEKLGATQVLVKELTGANPLLQIDAAECLCNYSLGEAHVCDKIVTTAGSYLVTYLDSNEPRLVRSCLWTLANILATSSKATKTLLQMQLLPKLWKIYCAHSDDLNLHQEDASNCLYLIASQSHQHLSDDDRRYIATHMHEKCPRQPGAEYFMFIIFQTEIFTMQESLSAKTVSHVWNFFKERLPSSSLDSIADKLHTIYGVRAMSNLFAMLASVEMDLQNLILQEEIAKILNQLFTFKDHHLNLDLLRLLKNFAKLKCTDINSLLSEIRIYET